MKTKINYIVYILLIGLIILTYMSLDYKISLMNSDKKKERIEWFKKDSILNNKLDSITKNINQISAKIKPIKGFLNALGYVESNNNYYAVNTFGFIGKYQFGNSALVECGVCESREKADIFRKQFINTPDSLKDNIWSKTNQNIAMKNFMESNKRNLYNYIAKHKNKYLYTLTDTIYITESGMIAAAHLAGCSNVKKFFDDINHDFKDGYGTTIESYLIKFSGFKV